MTPLSQGDVVARDKIVHIHQATETVFSPLHQLPEPSTHFTGRTDELAQLEPLLARRGAYITGLRGMGGVGKTALACALGARGDD